MDVEEVEVQALACIAILQDPNASREAQKDAKENLAALTIFFGALDAIVGGCENV